MRLRKYFIPEKPANLFYEQVPPGVCPNCENVLTGSYCSACGQKDRVRKDFTLSSFLGEAFHQFTHFDSKFFMSFKLLLFKPGALTVAYLRGKRSTYMKPVQLFIVINILYFLYLYFIPISTFTSYLDIQYNQLPYSKSVAKPMVDEKVQALGISFGEYAKEFDRSIGSWAKTLVVLMIPLLAIELAVLYLLRRFYFVEHLVFATHFFSFFLILASVGVTLLILLFELIMNMTNTQFSDGELQGWISIIPGIIAGVYLYIAQRKVYRETWLVTFLKTSVVMLSFIYLLNIYRLILFFVTFYTVKIH